MKLALVILVMLSTAFVVSEAACLRVCFFKKVNVLVCTRFGCGYRIRYRYLCIYVGCGKRSMGSNVEIGYPCNFAEYDTNKDGQIDENEFKTALKVSDLDAVLENFKSWDKNGDGAISCGEFLNSGHEFRCKPQDCRSTDEADEELWNTNN